MEIFYYLFFGVLTDMLLQYINTDSSQENSQPPAVPTTSERLIVIILWPMVVGVFIFGFFKELFK